MLELPPNPDYSLVNRSLLITQEQQLHFAVQIAYGLVSSFFWPNVLGWVSPRFQLDILQLFTIVLSSSVVKNTK